MNELRRAMTQQQCCFASTKHCSMDSQEAGMDNEEVKLELQEGAQPCHARARNMP